MPGELSFSVNWERLEEGAPEERASFGSFAIRWNDHSLTEGQDLFINSLRQGPLISAYPLAEWLAWNWWRLRWEPRAKGASWDLAHRLSAIGSGYVWPDISIYSDGKRIVLDAHHAQYDQTTSFRYTSNTAIVVPATQFQGEIDRFLQQVSGKLFSEGLKDTNLQRVWDEICAERGDPEIAQRRRFEALLGFEPDEGDQEVLSRLLEDAQKIDVDAFSEVAADHIFAKSPTFLESIEESAKTSGYDTENVGPKLPPAYSEEDLENHPAWQVGVKVARTLRQQETLGSEPLSNQRLSEMLGISKSVLPEKKAGQGFSFILSEGTKGRLVLRSKWEVGRRFEAARLLGDRLIFAQGRRLSPATRTYTYRQKLQRAFAAELLCPYGALDGMLEGDYSDEKIEEAATHFKISERAVRTILVNHGRLDREDLDGDVEARLVA